MSHFLFLLRHPLRSTQKGNCDSIFAPTYPQEEAEATCKNGSCRCAPNIDMSCRTCDILRHPAKVRGELHVLLHLLFVGIGLNMC